VWEPQGTAALPHSIRGSRFKVKDTRAVDIQELSLKNPKP